MSNSGEAQHWWFDRVSESIARQHYNPNVTSVSKFGKNNDIDASSTYEDITTLGALYPFPTSAGVLSVASSSSQDASGGTGTTQIHIEGLDSTYAEIEETLTLTGTTPVNTTNSYLRINRMFIKGTVGSNGTNVGNINATHPVAGVIGQIEAEEGQTLQAIYTVPLGHTGFLQHVHAHIDNGTTGVILLQIYRRVNLGGHAGGWRASRIGTSTSDKEFDDVVYNSGSPVTEGDDIRLSAQGVSGTNLVVTGGFDIVLFATGTG